MRIFFASICTTVVNGVPGIYTTNLRDTLTGMGHEVVESRLDWDGMLLRSLSVTDDARTERASASARLVDEVATAHRRDPIDLFLSSFWSLHVEPAAIGQIRALGIPTVNYYCDGAHAFNLVSEISPSYDLCWATEVEAMPRYRAIGAPAVHIQMGANPRFYTPNPRITRDVPVLFFGNLWADRPQVLANLIRKGAPVRIVSGMGCVRGAEGSTSVQTRASAPPFLTVIGSAMRETVAHARRYGVRSMARRIGRKYSRSRANAVVVPRVERYPDRDVMLEMFARSEIILNLCHAFQNNEPGGALVSYVRLRDFEVPMARGLLFPQHCDELEQYYDVEKEVVAWRSTEEACDKIQFFLRHPDEAERVRRAGYQRARRDHTWENRFDKLFRHMALPERVGPREVLH